MNNFIYDPPYEARHMIAEVGDATLENAVAGFFQDCCTPARMRYPSRRSGADIARVLSGLDVTLIKDARA